MVANFSAAALNHLMAEIGVLIHTSSHNRDYALQTPQSVGSAKDKEALAGSVDCIGYIDKLVSSFLALFPSPHVEAAMKALKRWDPADIRNMPWDLLFTRACNLRDAINIELKDHLFFSYSREEGQKIRTFDSDWGPIFAAFPSVRMDALGATDCYALQHHTASVFHSMRVAEHGLRIVARERKLRLPKNKPIEWGTWQEVIKALDDEIKRIGSQAKAGRAKDVALAFYSGVRADLNGFKDEYRNQVMHVRADYDEAQALRALSKVQDFMRRLAERRKG